MKLSVWNWLHLLAPYAISLLCYYNWEETFLGWLFLGYFLIEMITMAPYMNREVKTGRSFTTKYGRIEEYQTVKGESGNDMENMTGKIHVVHFLGMILIIIYAIYSLFSSLSIEKQSNVDIDTISNTTIEATKRNNEEDIINIDSSESDEEIDTTTYEAEKVEEIITNASNDENSNTTIVESKYSIYDLGYSINYNEAESECRSRKMRLPNYNELIEISNSLELMKKLKPIDKSQSYWSSTDYIDGQPFINKESVQGNDSKNYKKNYNPYTEKTVMTDTRIPKNCICIEQNEM